MNAHTDTITSFELFKMNGNDLLISGSHDTVLKAWNIVDGKIQNVLAKPHPFAITCIQ